MDNQSKTVRVAKVFSLYEKFGEADYIGEPVSQMEHMCQSGQLAEREGYDAEVILASFFHDIGHLLAIENEIENMGGYGAKRHEQIGANFLRQMGFPERVAELVENHVQAKRYLTYKYPEYLAKLSEASLETLGYQGGPMGVDEALVFEDDPLFDLSLKMRTWDEEAKLENMPLPNLDKYRAMALEIIR